MQHRELYRSIVPENAYIITYTDLASCNTTKMAKRIAESIYYKIGNNFSNDAMNDGKAAHLIKENELSDEWSNEVKMSYKMSDNYYLCGTMDRYYINDLLIEDYKTTLPDNIINYVDSNQIETYAFLALRNDMQVKKGRYVAISKEGEVLNAINKPIEVTDILYTYSSFILPRFNMIKKEIEILCRKFKPQ